MNRAKIDRGGNATLASSVAKYCPGDIAVVPTDGAGQVFRASGHTRKYDVERLYRVARITQFCEGTNQIRRTIMASELLKNGVAA